jgi:hypothetical protein
MSRWGSFPRRLFQALAQQTAAVGTLAAAVATTGTAAGVLLWSTTTGDHGNDNDNDNDNGSLGRRPVPFHMETTATAVAAVLRPPSSCLCEEDSSSASLSSTAKNPERTPVPQLKRTNQKRPASANRKRRPTPATAAATNREESSFQDKYYINPDDAPLGQGAYATVYYGVDRATRQPVAVKRFGRPVTQPSVFQREMRVLQYILQFGGHPHICGLHDFFASDPAAYHVVVDFVSGGEMFDHLINVRLGEL